MKIPRHIAIIMDGNGRWAQRQNRARSDGHFRGVDSVVEITRACSDLGVKYLTLYGFSTENWRRPAAEVDILMRLIGSTVEEQTPMLLENNARLKVIGQLDRIPEQSRRQLEKGMQATAHCTGLTQVMALSYSARWELTEMARRVAREAAAGLLNPDDITEQTVAERLTTAGIPDPDLLIRTGGEQRISNYLLWQCAYTEFYFTDTLWPDFRKPQLLDAIEAYNGRERRFGKTSAQVSHQNTSESFTK